ncbi:unnamed protein product [Closterium sp. Naga37s-1]|nr:unnamed protein product [Closterium sp. Naga37s-1]
MLMLTTSHIHLIPYPPHPISTSSHIHLIPSPPHPISASSHLHLIPSLPHPISTSSHLHLIPSPPHPISASSHLCLISSLPHPISTSSHPATCLPAACRRAFTEREVAGAFVDCARMCVVAPATITRYAATPYPLDTSDDPLPCVISELGGWSVRGVVPHPASPSLHPFFPPPFPSLPTRPHLLCSPPGMDGEPPDVFANSKLFDQLGTIYYEDGALSGDSSSPSSSSSSSF